MEIGGGAAGGDLLTARRDGNQVEGRGTRRDRVPCTPALDLAGVNPRREEITSGPGVGERPARASNRRLHAEYAPKFGLAGPLMSLRRRSEAMITEDRGSP